MLIFLGDLVLKIDMKIQVNPRIWLTTNQGAKRIAIHLKAHSGDNILSRQRTMTVEEAAALRDQLDSLISEASDGITT